ncbi:hypothetical protein B0H14DRAFT_2561517 [Mycena olivaceomarginata]|nr:hypothetical protein B0H14DRAFT_2561517 [Mycena olivaceomarginata]
MPDRYTCDERKFMQNWNSSQYHARHREERNAKTRERMARLRARECKLPKEEQEARRLRRLASAQKYRQKNAWRLAKEAREGPVVLTTLKTNPKLPKSSIWQQGETWQTPLVPITLGQAPIVSCRAPPEQLPLSTPLGTRAIVAWQVGCAAGEHDHGVDPTNDQGFVASSPDLLHTRHTPTPQTQTPVRSGSSKTFFSPSLSTASSITYTSRPLASPSPSTTNKRASGTSTSKRNVTSSGAGISRPLGSPSLSTTTPARSFPTHRHAGTSGARPTYRPVSLDRSYTAVRFAEGAGEDGPQTGERNGQYWEELARLQERMARVEAQLAGEEWTGSDICVTISDGED